MKLRPKVRKDDRRRFHLSTMTSGRHRKVQACILVGLATALLLNLQSLDQYDASEVDVAGCLTLSSVSSQVQSSRSPIDQRGEWIGHSWIPPDGWKLYKQFELQQVFNRSILWVGDSTARRAAATIDSVLRSNTTHASAHVINRPDKLDVNKHRLTENCTKFGDPAPNFCWDHPVDSRKEYIFLGGGPCLKDVIEFAQQEHSGPRLTPRVDVLVVATGIWEVLRPSDCQYRNMTLRDKLQATRDALAELQVPVVWRTTGYAQDEDSRSIVDVLNRDARTIFPNVVDWAGAMEPRSFGPDRIKGDIPAHYGLTARFVFMQQLANLWAKHTTQ